jgi:hypothetical protein
MLTFHGLQDSRGGPPLIRSLIVPVLVFTVGARLLSVALVFVGVSVTTTPGHRATRTDQETGSCSGTDGSVVTSTPSTLGGVGDRDMAAVATVATTFGR